MDDIKDRLCGRARVMWMTTTMLQREKIIQLYWTIQKEDNWEIRGMEEARGMHGEIYKIVFVSCMGIFYY